MTRYTEAVTTNLPGRLWHEPLIITEYAAQFTRRLRPPIRRSEITCSIRIWQRPQAKVGGRYSVEGGPIDVDSMRGIERDDITRLTLASTASRARRAE